MNRKLIASLFILFLATLACGPSSPGPIPTLKSSPYDLGRTVYGFFPSPPEATTQSIMDTYKAIGQHGDVALLQQNIPWKEFTTSADAELKAITDIHNQYILAHQNGLEVIFVVDPLNGLDRREFQGLPADWQASFANPKVRGGFQKLYIADCARISSPLPRTGFRD